MKLRLLFLALFAICTNFAKGQLSTNAYYDGYWGGWKQQYIQGYSMRTDYYQVYGNYYGFIVFRKGDHPSKYVFKFNIDNTIMPTKKEIKYHYKQKIWYEYSGSVEYFVSESDPTIKGILRQWGFPLYSYDSNSHKGEPIAKRVAKAKIKIEPYKDHPRVYNIWFDDVGIALDLGLITF